MPTISAGILMFRWREGEFQVLLVHPGGPFFRHRDDGAWSIPKGVVAPDENLLEGACREFTEETGVRPSGAFIPLQPTAQKGGKVIHAWALEGDLDPRAVVSNTFRLEWPPHSGQQVEFPEVDRAEFFEASIAKRKINPSQRPLIEQLECRLGRSSLP